MLVTFLKYDFKLQMRILIKYHFCETKIVNSKIYSHKNIVKMAKVISFFCEFDILLSNLIGRI